MLMLKYIPDCQIYSDFSSHVRQTLQMSVQRSHDTSEARPPTDAGLLALKNVLSNMQPGLDYDMVDII